MAEVAVLLPSGVWRVREASPALVCRVDHFLPSPIGCSPAWKINPHSLQPKACISRISPQASARRSTTRRGRPKTGSRSLGAIRKRLCAGFPPPIDLGGTRTRAGHAHVAWHGGRTQRSHEGPAHTACRCWPCSSLLPGG